MKTCLRRRSFLKAGAAAFTILPAHVLRAETAPSNQLTRALIGFGGIARSGNHLGYKAIGSMTARTFMPYTNALAAPNAVLTANRADELTRHVRNGMEK